MRVRRNWHFVAGAALAIAISPNPFSQPALSRTWPEQWGDGSRTRLPVLPQPYQGALGPTVEQSGPRQFPAAPAAPANAPNVLVVLLDDVGFGAASAFGGPVPTPSLERLANRGLRYTNFHVTGLCSPTRAALLTGRNHHSVGTGRVVDMPIGYPGYAGVLPKSAASVAEVLRQNGYNTAMFGKHHNTPRSQATPAGPFDTWPTGLGFEYFYGFIGGDDDQFTPTLYRGTARVQTPTAPDYILDADLADDAINWVHNQKGAAPDKPFFVYLAPGTTHAPHQAPRAWIDRFRGQFDSGWDAVRENTFARQKAMGIVPANAALTPRPTDIADWSSLTADQRRLYARMMEVFAGTLAHEDYQIGRVIAELERMGEFDNTLIMFISGDNGPSAEGGLSGTTNEMGKLGNNVPETERYMLSVIDELGGPGHHNNYPAGWAWATSTPFPWVKQVASHLGATTNGMVVSWPKEIQAHGQIRSQFHHVVDIMPTILQAANIDLPTDVNGVPQQPVDGISMAYSFEAKPSDQSRRHTQYFEMFGNRAIYHHGWWAGTTPKRPPWSMNNPGGNPATSYRWELYDLRSDFTQSRNLAQAQPAKLKELQALWSSEAEKHSVFPLMDSVSAATFGLGGEARKKWTYWGPVGMPEGAGPSLRSRSFTITAEVDLSRRREGVILSAGASFGGWSFYLNNGKIVAYSAFSQQPGHKYRVAGPAPTGTQATIKFDFDYDGGGTGKGGLLRISADGREVARGRVEHTTIIPQNSEEFNVGYDSGSRVSPDYTDEFPLGDAVRRVDVELR
jgi:arylsulfatase